MIVSRSRSTLRQIYVNIVLKGYLFLFSINNHIFHDWRSPTKCSINLADLLQQTNERLISLSDCHGMYSLVSISFFIFQLYFADSSCKNQGEQFQATQKSRSGYVSYNVFQQKSNVFVANCSDLKTWKKVKSERYRHLWFSFILLLSTFIITIVCNSEPCGYLGSAPTDSIFPVEVPEDIRLREGLARSGSHATVLHVLHVHLEHTKEGFTMGLIPAWSVQHVTAGKKLTKSWENRCNL